MSTRQAIIEALAARVQTTGYPVVVGEAAALGEDDPDVIIAVIPQDTAPRFQGMHIYDDLPIEIQVLAKANLDAPYIAAETVLGQVIEAVELEDRTLGGLVRRQLEVGGTRYLPREEGSTTVGAAITYGAPYTRLWGQP